MTSTSRNRTARHLTARWAADPHVLMAVAVVIAVLAIEVVTQAGEARAIVLPSVVYLGLQLGITAVRRNSGEAVAFDAGRLLIALGAVFWMNQLTGDLGTFPLTSLYIPIVAMGAAMGTREAVILGIAALIAFLYPVLGTPAFYPVALQRGAALIATTIVLAIGTRRTVSSLERAVEHVRRTSAAHRRRARQMAAVEEVGRVLASSGPTTDALDHVMDVLVARFGYRYVSIYTVDGPLMRLGAQRGYDSVIETFDGSLGVVGRVMRTGQPELVRDVTTDPDYRAANHDVRSEVSVPLRVDDQLLGVLNVESGSDVQLDEGDRDTMVVVGDRVAVALALGRERQALRERVALFGRLAEFGASINASLDPATAHESIVRAVRDVLHVDSASLIVRDIPTGEDRIVAMSGGDPRYVGVSIPAGEGMAGQAMAVGQVVASEVMSRAEFPSTMRGARTQDQLVGAAAPLLREGVVVGALGVSRDDLERPFSPLELESLALIASQIALAVTNVALHAQVADAAIRDPLTGLWNRRHLDVSLARMFAARARQEPDDRRPVAAILFDLDHFGLFNKRHGHGVGDSVLRAFGGILTRRLRSTTSSPNSAARSSWPCSMGPAWRRHSGSPTRSGASSNSCASRAPTASACRPPCPRDARRSGPT